MAISTIPSAGLATSVANPITMVDQWNLTTGFTLAGGSSQPITTNLARSTAAGFAKIGTGMSQSSGIFTFPTTGVYRVDYGVIFYINSGDSANRYVQQIIMVSTDGSSFTESTYGTQNLYGVIASAGTYCQTYSTSVVNVTNTSLVKVRFDVNCATGVKVTGGSPAMQTYMTFTRLGDSQ